MSNNSVVLELQNDILSGKLTLDILRKAYMIAQKLDLQEFKDWLKKELNGYSSDDILPDYRFVPGQLKAKNPYHGWIPIQFGNPKTAETFSSCPISQPIGELETLNSRIDNDGSFEFLLSAELKHRLINNMEYAMDIKCFIPGTSPKRILDAVRNNIMEWSLELEKQNILGEGMRFTQDEQKEAQSISIGTIQNFAGNIGSNPGEFSIDIKNQISGSVDTTQLQTLLTQIDSALEGISLEPTQYRDIQDRKSQINSELSKDNPNFSVLKQEFQFIAALLANTSGNLLASGICYEIQKLFS